MSSFLNAIERLNNPDLNDLDSLFSVQRTENMNPSFDNMVFSTALQWDIIEHDLCHCLTFALDDKLDRLRLKNFGYQTDIISPLENVIEEWKVLTMHGLLSVDVQKCMDKGDFHHIPQSILSRAYPDELIYQEHVYQREPWIKQLHPDFTPNLMEFNRIKLTLPAFTLDDVRTAATKLKEYFQ